MNSNGHLSSAPVPVMIGGKTYRFSPKVNSPDAWAEVAHIIKGKRKSSLDRLVGKLDKFTPEQQAVMIDRAMQQDERIDDDPTPAEIDRFLASLEGLSVLVWIAARDQHPELACPQDCLPLIAGKADEMQKKLDKVGGFSALGES